MKRFGRILLFLVGAGGLVYLFNETPFLYHEPNTYQRSDPKAYFSPAVTPIYQTQPGHDTLLLLFHGFPSSPQEFRALADALGGEVDVAAPLLPGFGTTHAAMRDTYFQQWLAYARDEYTRYRTQYRHVYLGGQSMGGVLALRLAQTLPAEQAPDGLVLMATPVFLNALWSEGVLYDWRLYLSRFLAWAMPELKTPEPVIDQDGAVWVGFRGVKFLRQIHSLKMGMYAVRKELAQVRVPVLMMHSRGDKTVPFENLFYLGRHLGSADIRLRVFDLRTWKHKRHVLTLYRTTQPEVIRLIREWLRDHATAVSPAKGHK